MLTKQQEEAYRQIIVRSWVDAEFRDDFINNPKEVLNAHGFQIPHNIAVTVKPDSVKGKVEFGLPARPNISDDDLRKIVGPVAFGTF